MKISKDYLTSFLKKDVIPKTAWSTKYVNGKLCYHIKNPVYCQVFWLDFWYNELSVKFKKQNMIEYLENQELDLPIIITEDYILLNVPKPIQNIDYFSQERLIKTPFMLNMSLNSVMLLTIISFTIVIVCTLIWGSKSRYSMII